MANPKLIEYIKDSISRGSTAEDIRMALLETGWPQEDINAGLAEATAMQSPAQPPAPQPQRKDEKPVQKKGNKKLIVLLIILFMLVMLLLYAALSILGAFTAMFPDGMDSINNLMGGGGG